MIQEETILALYADEDESLSVIEEGEWTQDYKYQLRAVIVLHVPTGQHWEISESRSGSYHTDWYYDEPTARRVVRKEETRVIVTWVAAPP